MWALRGSKQTRMKTRSKEVKKLPRGRTYLETLHERQGLADMVGVSDVKGEAGGVVVLEKFYGKIHQVLV